MIRTLTPLKASLVATTALVAVGVVAVLPDTRQLLLPPGGRRQPGRRGADPRYPHPATGAGRAPVPTRTPRPRRRCRNRPSRRRSTGPLPPRPRRSRRRPSTAMARRRTAGRRGGAADDRRGRKWRRRWSMRWPRARRRRRRRSGRSAAPSPAAAGRRRSSPRAMPRCRPRCAPAPEPNTEAFANEDAEPGEDGRPRSRSRPSRSTSIPPPMRVVRSSLMAGYLPPTGCGAGRGDGELLPLCLPAARWRGSRSGRRVTVMRDAVEPRHQAGPYRAAGRDAGGGRPAAAEPGVPDRHLGLDGGRQQAAAADPVVPA